MDKNIKFGETETEKHKCDQHKNPILIYDVDINKIFVSKKASFGKKRFQIFCWLQRWRKVRPLCVMLSKANACRRDFDATEYVFFDKSELLEKYIEIWDKVSNTIKKGFDNEPVYNEKYLRTKIKSYDVKISTHFYREETPKEGFPCTRFLFYKQLHFWFQAREAEGFPDFQPQSCL